MALATFGGLDDFFGPMFERTADFPMNSALAAVGRDQPSMRGMALDVVEKNGALATSQQACACILLHGITACRAQMHACPECVIWGLRSIKIIPECRACNPHPRASARACLRRWGDGGVGGEDTGQITSRACL